MTKNQSIAKSPGLTQGIGTSTPGRAATSRHAGWYVTLLVLLAVLLGGVAGVVGARWWAGTQTNGLQQQQLQHELSLSQGDLIQVQAKLDVALANVAVEASTRKALEATLQETQTELGHLRDQLAFFNQLFPPGPAGAVSIRALDIQEVGPNLQYRALLMRSGATGSHFKGRMQFLAKGLQDGKAVKMELHPAHLPDQAEPMLNDAAFPLDFEQFQRSGGLLSVPAGFIVQTITLNILEGSTVRVSRTVSLPVPD